VKRILKLSALLVSIDIKVIFNPADVRVCFVWSSQGLWFIEAKENLGIIP